MMQEFSYLAINHHGERVKGQLVASNLLDAERQLTQMNFDVLSLKVKKKELCFWTCQKVNNKDIITMTFQIEQLLGSGVPLLDILQDMQSSMVTGYFKGVLAGVYDAMLNGATFAEALSRYPNTFNEVYINLVSVGEKTGQLELILHDLGVSLRWQDELTAKAKKVMIYPSIVFSVVMMVMSFLMIFLVPELVSFIQSMGQELSFITRSLLAFSDYFVNYWHITIIFLVFWFIAFILLMNNSLVFRHTMHRWQFAIPLVGSIIFKLKIARMMNTMAVMYAAGISLQQMINMAGKVVSNDYLLKHLQAVEKNILDGSGIATSFSSVGIFPPLIIKLIKVGETTGRMDEALRNVSYFYDREAKEAIEKLEPAIEPIITLVLALLVAWVMIATLGPVYDIMGKIN